MSDLDADLDAAGKLWIDALKAKKPRAEKATKRGSPEMDAQKAVVAWLRKAGCIVSRNINELQSKERDPNKRARFWMSLVKSGCTKSFPDLTAILPDGRTCLIEMKAPTKEPNEDQEKLHDKLRQRGAIVVWGTDIWSVEAALAEQGVRI